jgi:hypothetical protein
LPLINLKRIITKIISIIFEEIIDLAVKTNQISKGKEIIINTKTERYICSNSKLELYGDIFFEVKHLLRNDIIK